MPLPPADQLRERIDSRTRDRVLNTQLGIENIRRHSFENKTTGKGFGNSTVLSGSIQDERLNGGKPTLIPFLYNGKRVEPQEAADRAVASGKVWPSFDTDDEATAVSKRISSKLGEKR